MDDLLFLRLFLTVFQSYQDDGRMMMTGYVLWHPVTVRTIPASSRSQTSDR